MMHLIHNPGISQETLVKVFHIDRGTIARSVKKLEESGYITRYTDPDNRRAVQLYLTDEGKKITPDLIQIDRDWETSIISTLHPSEQDQIKPMLQKIASASLQCIREMGELEYGTCFARGEKIE
jgi:DNA-binding MarR family transcriptional regulator